VIKAITILAENAEVARSEDDYVQVISGTDELEEGDEDTDEGGEDAEASDEQLEENGVRYRRMMCMAHSIQLIIKKAYTHYNTVQTEARYMVGKMTKSGMAMQKLQLNCGKTVFSDNPTRWNSTFNMKKLVALRGDVNQVN